MIKRIILLLIFSVFGIQHYVVADEGMWLPLLLKKLNESDMQRAGLKLTAEDIYQINNSSMKDAIVRLGGGFCTAEMISPEGLMLTNHHCAYDAIQDHSSVEHDYLTDGFWARTKKDELSNPGLTADFLVRIEDVTNRIYKEIGDTMTEGQRSSAIQKAMASIIKDVGDSNGYKAEVKSFFKGNEYYLFVYQIYRDVRLVGAPPSSIGKFGGDTDNWMWPRHTGDFALFRVYMSKEGKPSEYSPENIPFKPKHFLPVSMEGVKKDDFAMTMGYPGTTDRYLTSEGVKMALEQSNPVIIKVREKKLAIMKEDMDASDAVRIQYSAKYYQTSNYYKYFIGQSKGLTRMGVVEKKQEEEGKFAKWAADDTKRKEKYGNVISDLINTYAEARKYNLHRVYLSEAVFQGPEILIQAYQYKALNDKLADKEAKPEDIKALTEKLREGNVEFFKNYHAATDQKLYGALLKMYFDEVPVIQHPDFFEDVKKKYKGDFKAYAAAVFAKSIFSDSIKCNAFLEHPSAKKLTKDPAFIAINSIIDNFYSKIQPATRSIDQKLNRNNRAWVAGLREMYPDRKFYPDANSTMRLSYGKVADYFPMDAVYYNFFTTLDGIMEKRDDKNSEFKVPKKLAELYQKKDYGRYGTDGKMNVCFITTNDITGGNSGSPVINGKGELIGLAFDGNWEAMSGDIAYDPVYKRCINVDIRYVLFIIDKFAGATNLINEMRITGDVRASAGLAPN